MDRASQVAAADVLATAESARSPVKRVSEQFPGLDVADAYEIQLRNIARRVRAGAVIRGHKVGLSSRAMQQMMQVSEPDYGHLLGRPVLDFAGLDLSLLSALVERDGEVISSGAGARVLGSPARSVAWVVNALSHMRFELRAGMIVFTGAIADPVAVTAGHVISAEFAHLGRIGFTAV